MKRVLLVTIAALGCPAIAVAQDAMFQNLAGNQALIRDHNRIRENALDLRRGPSKTPGAPPYAPVAQNIRAPAFSYVSTATSRRDAVSGFIARVSQTDPSAGKAYGAELQKSDVFAFYSKLIGGSAYRSNDAADALAAYIALGYIIVNGGNTSHAQEAALRTQVALRASSNPSFTPGNRTALAEELKIMTVVMHSGFQGAERVGKQREYADGIARLFASSGIDLRALRLTDRGLVAR